MKPVFNILIGILIGLLLAGGIWISAREPEGQSITLRPAPTPQDLVVHVAGAVVRPGVYRLPENSRVQDAINAAGGFLAEADKNSFNLAALLEDGERLDVPYTEGFTPVPDTFTIIPNATPDLSIANEDLINVNTASLSELDTLPGIGPTTAQKIIDYRNANGPFGAIDDIQNVSGIGPATYDKIKDLITVGQ